MHPEVLLHSASLLRLMLVLSEKTSEFQSNSSRRSQYSSRGFSGREHFTNLLVDNFLLTME